eukprot:3732017-Pyramimonas_sp.AAC.1
MVKSDDVDSVRVLVVSSIVVGWLLPSLDAGLLVVRAGLRGWFVLRDRVAFRCAAHGRGVCGCDHRRECHHLLRLQVRHGGGCE